MAKARIGFGGIALMALAVAGLWSGAAEAQTGDSQPAGDAAAAASAQPEALGDIVVTAQRRSQKLQDVPLAVSAFDSKQLKTGVVQSIVNLDGKIPNVILEPVGAFPFAGTYSIRGLGYADVESASEPTVGVEVDGVYQARNVGTVQDFFDIDQVTILRGPQGTLYGRNAIGGVVSIRTKRPGDDFHTEALGTLGSYGRREIRAAAEGPIVTDVLSARLSMLGTNYEGYYHNDYNGADGRRFGQRNVFGIRGTVVLTPSSNFDATLIVDHSNERGTGNPMTNASLPGMVLSNIGYPADPNQPPYHTEINGDIGNTITANIKTTGETLEMNWRPGAIKLTSITGYRKTYSVLDSDFDGTPISFLNVDNREHHHQFSQELRLSSDTPGSPLTYVFGLYYLSQRFDNVTGETGLVFGGPNAGSDLITGQTTHSYAAFGQVDYKLFDKLTLTAGARYSRDSKRFSIQPLFYPTSETFKKPFNDFSPKAAITYQWTPQLLTYVQYSRGYRAGGFNGRAGSFTAVGPYGSENVDSFEAGLKSELFDRRLTANFAAFTERYSHMQQTVQQALPGTTINQTVTLNAASARIQGFEGELTLRAARGLTIHGSFGYLDTHFSKFVADLGDGLGLIDRSNLPFSFAPKWNAALTGTYTVPASIGTFTLQGSARYQSRIYTSFTPLNILTDAFVRPKNVSFDASLAFETLDKQWTLSVYAKNISNLHLMNNTFAVGPLLADRVYQPPREVGLQLGFKY